MKTLIVFEKDNGRILYSEVGAKENIEVGSVLVDIPEGKYLVGIDTNGQPIIEDIPMSLEERIAQLEASQEDQDGAIMELADIIAE